MVEKTYRAFWSELLRRLKDESPHRAWTLSFRTPIGGRPTLVVEHEFNHHFPRELFEREVHDVIKSHWPVVLPEKVAVHHIEARSLDLATGAWTSMTTVRNEPALMGRSNVILVGVPSGALDALRELGGVRPEAHEILRHG